MNKTLDFYTAPWCSTCKTIKDMILAEAFELDVKVNIIDLSVRPESGEGITTLPTFRLPVKGGSLYHFGSISKIEFRNWLKNNT